MHVMSHEHINSVKWITHILTHSTEKPNFTHSDAQIQADQDSMSVMWLINTLALYRLFIEYGE